MKYSGVSFKKVNPLEMFWYDMDSARMRISLVVSKAIKKQKFVSCDMDISTGPQNRGMMKRHGAIHRSKKIETGFMNLLYNKKRDNLSTEGKTYIHSKVKLFL